MKVVIKIIALLFLMSFSTKAQWFWQNPLPQGNNLLGINIFSNDSILLVGNVGTMLLTINGGNDWKEVLNIAGQFKVLNSIQFIDQKIGYLAGDTLLFKTTDGGTSWSMIFHTDITSMAFTTRNKGYILSGNDIYQTLDGGSTWSKQTLQSSFTLVKIGFADSLKGWILGYAGTLFKTTNGGTTWTQTGLAGYWGLLGIFFLDSNIGWIVGEAGKIYKTTNGGSSWIVQHTGNNWDKLIGVYFKNQQYGWSWGDLFLKTTDSGTTWSNQAIPVSDEIINLKFADSNTGWAVGNNGVIMKSTDGGMNWTQESKKILAFRFNGTDWVSSQEGWVTGYNSYATSNLTIHSIDGGKTWNAQSVNIGEEGSSIFFINKDTGWISTTTNYSGGHIFKTTDNGESWAQKFASINALKRIQFVTPSIGWAVGGNTVLKSTDGGEQWIGQPLSVAFQSINSCFFCDSLSGWVVGNGITSGALICKTTSGGASWLVQSLSPSWDYPMSVFFMNVDTGWVAGEREMIYATTDGGTHWIQQHLNEGSPSLTLNSIWFVDNYNGWAVGAGNILRTSNGGISWIDQLVCDKSLYDVRFIDSSTGWVVGSYGVILKTTNGGVTFVEEDQNNELPKEFKLSQNYPNPFNPSTTIRYAIPLLGGARGGSQLVQLKVYDLLGREVATLVNEEKEPGIYRADFSTQNYQLASGIYLYRLYAGNYVETKKMVLIK